MKPKEGMLMIRLATHRDAPTVAALYQQLTQEMAALAPTIIQPRMLPNLNYFNQYIADAASDVLLSVDEHDQIQGFLLIVIANTGTDDEVVYHEFGFIIDLMVTPAARHAGVGQALLAAAADWSRQHDLEFLQLNVLAANLAGRDFYAKAGFTPSALTLQKPL